MKSMLRYKKCILYVVVINIICFGVIRFYLMTSSSKKKSKDVSTEIPSGCRLHYPCCRPRQNQSMRKNIYFLKTHKTASSTVQNILMRFGYRHSLNFLLPKKKNYLGYKKSITASDLDQNSIPADGKFNIFTHHSRYNPTTSKFLYADAVRVTLLRDPPELFESLFHFYHLQNRLKMSFEGLLVTLPHLDRSQIDGKKHKFGSNQMSHDLGLDRGLSHDEKAIRNFVDRIDREFDFVMIKEYLEASLVLLANLMGWPLHYVSFIAQNSRTNTKRYELSKEDRHKLSQLNGADTLLYEHFLRKFRACALQYGADRLFDDVQKLYTINENLKNRCVLRKDFSGYAHTVGYVLKNNSDWDCVYTTKVELKFTDELRSAQIDRLKIVKKLQNFINEKQFP